MNICNLNSLQVEKYLVFLLKKNLSPEEKRPLNQKSIRIKLLLKVKII